MTRPADNEYAPYHGHYIALVKGDNIIKILESQVLMMQSLIADIPENKEDFRYAPGKWSVKEVLVHITDTERIMAYRALCIARGEKNSLPGFDENSYAKNSNASQRSLYDIGHEFSLVRASNIALFKNFDEATLLQKGIANQYTISVRALLYIIAGHELHHIHVMRSKYL